LEFDSHSQFNCEWHTTVIHDAVKCVRSR